jgi:DNA polymerase-3 subunit gamma/tau
MPYQVLARKYRPQRFADVIGQEHVTRTLLNALEQDRIAHGYIFSGHRGIGKTTIARILAMALQCRTPRGTPARPTPEPCGVCEACTEIRAGSSLDVMEIDAATNRGIDEIRELREGARYSPARDRYKIFILDEAHQITDAAFNALLKTLEEPPAHVVFMMATTQPEDIPQTIRSRSQHFSFHAVPFQQIVGQLRAIAAQESIEADELALSLLAEAGDGSMRDALSIMDQAIASAPLVEGRHMLDGGQIRSLMGTVSNQVFEAMMEAVEQRDAAAMLELAANLLDAGNGPQPIARQMVRFLRNCLMARIAGEKSDLLQISTEEAARAARVASKFSEEDLTRFLNSMLRTFDDLGYRQEQRFHLELGLLKLVHMQRLLPFEEIFQQLKGSGTAPAPRGSGSISGSTSAPASRTSDAVSASPRANTPPGTALESVFSRAPSTERSALLADSPALRPAAPPAATPSSAPAQAADAPSQPASSIAPAAAASSAAAGTVDVSTLREAICQALMAAGQETAAEHFDSGEWKWDGTELQIGVPVSRVVLEMAYNQRTQQLVRETFRKVSGSSKAVRVESRPDVTPSGQTKRTAPVLENGVRPEDHPIIRHAQELFHAEIRSVVSLRNS